MEGIQTTVKFAGPGDSVAVIKVGGYIDTTTSSELERTLGTLLKKNQHRIDTGRRKFGDPVDLCQPVSALGTEWDTSKILHTKLR